MNRLSLAKRVTLLAAVAVGLAVAVTSLAAYVILRQQLYSTLDQSLLDRATGAAEGGVLRRVACSENPASTDVLGAADIRFAIISADGQRCSPRQPGEGDITIGKPEIRVAAGEAPYSLRTISSTTGADYRVVGVPDGPGTALVMAQSLGPTQATLSKLGFVMLVVGGTGVIVAAMAGAAVARSGLQPVRRLTRAAEEIARTDQLKPIDVTGDDEIARLATAFNEMLAALSASRERQRQLVADAGHELRTPLTSLRTNVDLLAQADSDGRLDEHARQELLLDVRAQTEELTTLIQDLVELARDEPLPQSPETVDLGGVVEEALERVRRRVHGRVRFDVQVEPWTVLGEQRALTRAVVNLLDNAVKWSPDDGTVTVRLRDGVLEVRDYGSGIEEGDLPHVFDRFYRASDARRMPGSGLGLAIVRQAAERHGGWVAAQNAPGGGAAFRLAIPPATYPRTTGPRTGRTPRPDGPPASGGRGQLPATHGATGRPR